MAIYSVVEWYSLPSLIILVTVFIPAIIYLILLGLGIVKKPNKKDTNDSDPFGDIDFGD